MENNNRIITNSKALVPGADGFIGSHLTEMLLEKDYKVRACLNIIHLTIGDD